MRPKMVEPSRLPLMRFSHRHTGPTQKRQRKRTLVKSGPFNAFRTKFEAPKAPKAPHLARDRVPWPRYLFVEIGFDFVPGA